MKGPRRLFAATILLGAFLLFQVQPLLSRWILPWFGGGTAVWTTCMLFFQTLLFAGYAYAHGLERLRPAARTLVHLALIAAALAMLPIAPPDVWKPEGAANPTWAILKLLVRSVGMPCLLLASTGPLVQAWSAREEPGSSPYPLYALSNLGSLAALLSYPFVIEPRWGLRAQASFWTWGFVVFAALSAAGALRVRTLASALPGGPEPQGRRLRVGWVALPAAASALLLATTNQLSQDIAVLPFLWVLPLAVYLVSFIIVFDRPAWYVPGAVLPATGLLSFGAAVVYYVRPMSPAALTLGVGVHLAALLGVCLVCHGELARQRPRPAGLTGYYLAIAGGGALGGLAVSLGAPLVFSTLFEWKLGIGLAYAGTWAATGWCYRGLFRAHLNLAAIGLVTAAVGLAFLLSFLSSYGHRLESARNFYGAVTVDQVAGPDGTGPGVRDLMNGRVLHGRQDLDPTFRRLPNTYYGEASGVGRALGLFQSRPDLRVGVVGLGAGTLAAYLRGPGQSVRFYEINPDVPRLADRWFTYLGDCAGKVEIVLGDARLSLDREPPQGFHVLALDAFSGHTVPTHLLTVEAFRIYLRHLRPEGILAVHVSNHFLRLEAVARGAAHQCGLGTLEIDAAEDGKTRSFESSWILCARTQELLGELRPVGSAPREGEDVAWTDDASDLFSILGPRATP